MINVKEMFDEIKENLRPLVSNEKKLAIIQVGDDPASSIYVANKIKDCEELGIPVKLEKLDENVTTERIRNTIKFYNILYDYAGIIVQLPLPEHIDTELVINTISEDQDVDGFRQNSMFIPATPKGVLTILDKLTDLDGKHVTLIGRGKTVGEPLMKLLLERNATLTICHSHTSRYDLKEAITHSDVVISAVGKPEFITEDMLRINNNFSMIPPNSVVKNEIVYADPIIIDVGISRVDGKQVGDVSREVHDIVSQCTPWVNGVGYATRVSLLQNLLEG